MGQAVEDGTINNQTIAYFMARTFLFLKSCGINEEGIRFRQHRSTEMAHYAKDCWDAEVETSYGWIEVAGHSDRSCFDLTRHAEKTKVELVAARPLKEPKTIQYIHVTLDKQKIGKTFKKDSKPVCELLDNLKDEQKAKYQEEMKANNEIVLDIDGKQITLSNEFVKLETHEKVIQEEKYTPSVIEPSFGIGRIIYCIFEHSFKMREKDAQRTYFTFPPLIAPVKCVLLPLINNQDLNSKATNLKSLLTKASLSSKIDDSGVSVGKRYARTDECGIPYAFTIDFETLENDTITMRDLDTMSQIRLPMAEAPILLSSLVNGFTNWTEASTKYPLVESKEKE
mmetsp:Transcript_11566/g.19543  ORF Transcript_11566/g.19543 Transcript_11566/m.19543 type:complete len:340 (-) Transcript_11566:170-1189(-)